MCQQYYCADHRNWETMLCDKCARHPETAASRRAPESSNTGCYIALAIFWLIPIVIFGIFLSLGLRADANTIRDAGDPFTNGFFLALWGLATVGLLWIFISLMTVARGAGRLFVIFIFVLLAAVGILLAVQVHQRYQNVITSGQAITSSFSLGPAAAVDREPASEHGACKYLSVSTEVCRALSGQASDLVEVGPDAFLPDLAKSLKQPIRPAGRGPCERWPTRPREWALKAELGAGSGGAP
jgi:hypothetical protein